MLIGVNLLSYRDWSFVEHTFVRQFLLALERGKHSSKPLLVVRPGDEHLFGKWHAVSAEHPKEAGEAAARAGADVLLSPLEAAVPKPPLPQCGFIFDARPFAQAPAKRGWFAKPAPPPKVPTQDFSQIFVPSQFLRKQLLEELEVPMDKVVVAPLGASKPFRTAQDLFVEKPFIFYRGPLGASANTTMLFDVFRKLASELPHTFIVASPTGGEEPGALPPRFLRVESAGETHLASLYQHCDCFVQPSVYDAAGLSIIEAMAAGAPIACGRVGCLPEIAGNVPFYFNPESSDSIIGVIRRVLDETGEARAQRSKAGQKAAAEYTWSECAWKIMHALKRL